MKTKVIFRGLLAAFFVVAGLNHFRDPAVYLGMMPPWLPKPELLVQISGVAEVLGGIGLLVPATRRFAGWGLVLLLVAIFPANLHAALQGRMPGLDVPPWGLWARLPFQFLFIAWVWWVALKDKRDETLD
ncbi:DoxX family protein [Oleiharenicola lentus]|uniref:DoxX family protein n=1 Tax=Oleiharenicola lentus TaxID=2508720 RepID=UPI003F66107C